MGRRLLPVETETVSVLDHIQAILTEMDRRYQQRFDAVKEAVSKAEIATSERFASVNEFRQTLTDQAGTFIGRGEFEAMREAYAERIRELTARLDRTEGRSTGFSAGWAILVGAVGLVAAVVAVFVNLR